MSAREGSSLNGHIKVPEHLRTNAEKIAWLGDGIRLRLLAIENADKTKDKATAYIALYEEAIALIRKEESEVKKER